MPFTKIPITYPIKFRVREILQHVSTNGVYEVVGLPDEYVLEHNGAPAYAYRMKGGPIFVRCQSEMEDGRFITLQTSEQGQRPYPPTEYTLDN